MPPESIMRSSSGSKRMGGRTAATAAARLAARLGPTGGPCRLDDRNACVQNMKILPLITGYGIRPQCCFRRTSLSTAGQGLLTAVPDSEPLPGQSGLPFLLRCPFYLFGVRMKGLMPPKSIVPQIWPNSWPRIVVHVHPIHSVNVGKGCSLGGWVAVFQSMSFHTSNMPVSV